MAVCNLFNNLTNASGNFLMFSQYVEDITRNYVDSDAHKVVPSKFIALNVDYSKIKKDIVCPNGENFNEGIPKYFQNCFENACAYGRENYAKWVESTDHMTAANKWNSSISRNLFWNNMFDGGFIHASEYGNTKKLDELVYYGNIAMHAYNEHQGMGYGEIYCYIPTDAGKMNCQVVCTADNDYRIYEEPPVKTTLEGHTDKFINNYVQKYYYNRDFIMSFDDPDVGSLLNSADSYYTFNTIVVLYDVLVKINDNWTIKYSDIPMGMYLTGRYEEGQITNTVTKYVTTSYGTGTSYGLRICTRFSVAPNNAILKEIDFVVDDSNYTNVCQLMMAMNENLSRMMDIVKSTQNTSNQYKELYSIFKNNKTNVPYVKDINGVDYWFVNGKFVAAVDAGTSTNGCAELNPETIQKRLNNLMDDDPDNNWDYIEDPNGCECFPLSNHEVVNGLKYPGLPNDSTDYWPEGSFDDYPEFGGGTTGGSGGGSGTNPDAITKENIASDADVADILNRTEPAE